MDELQFKDYYKVLGVPNTADAAQIKKAYRKLARKFHPDVSKAADANERMAELNEANDVLGDPIKRGAYDRADKAWHQAPGGKPPPGWNSGFEFGGNSADFDSDFASSNDFGNRSDFFEALFGSAQRGRGNGRASEGASRRKPADHFAKIVIVLEDSFNGASRDIVLQRPEVDKNGHLEMVDRTLRVTIPKGIRLGQSIRLAGQAHGDRGGQAGGDLLLEIEFAEHPIYTLSGTDVFLSVPVLPWELALGKAIQIPTPSGVVEISIPAGSKNGKKLRLKGRGIPSQVPGDFYATLNLVMPEVITDRSRELYKELEKGNSFNPRLQLERL
jgi:curved DNA-binding protein